MVSTLPSLISSFIMMFVGAIVGSSCGVLLQIIAGWLADIGLRQSFLVYVIALLLVLFCLKEPEGAKPAAKVQDTHEKVQIKHRVWLYIAILFVWCTLGYSIMTNMSTHIQMRGFGEAGVSGTILALYTLGGAVAAVFSSKLYPVFKRMFIPLCFFVGALGELLVLIGANIPMIAVGTTLAGAGYFCMQPQIFAFTGVVAGRTSTPLCTSIVSGRVADRRIPVELSVCGTGLGI